MPDPFLDIDEFVEGRKSISSGNAIVLEKAPNPIIFVTSDKFLGQPKKLFPSQFEILRNFFELLCPICNDAKAIKANEIDEEDQVLFEYDRCPKCGYYKYSDISRLKFYDELIGRAGMRGGKSMIAALIAHWIFHETLCEEQFQERLGLPSTQTIEGAFVATSGEQAEETVWDHFINMFDNSNWYTSYIGELKHLEKSRGLQPGKLFGNKSGKALFLGDRNIRLKSLHSNSSSLSGRTRLFAVIDELSRFDSGGSKRSAIEVYRVMRHSLTTIEAPCNRLRSQGVILPHPRMISISSPIFDDDLTMRFYREAEFQDRMFSFYKRTEDMNPNITSEDLASQFERDPIGSERDYHANPPGAENIFVEPDTVSPCIDESRKSMFDLKERFFERDNGGQIVKYVAINILDMRWSNVVSYFIHCDPGESSDSFCIAIGHRDKKLRIIDGAIEIRPVKKDKQNPFPKKVHFPSVLKLLLYLCETLSVAAISYDRWNSTDQTQRLIDAGVTTIQKNLSRDDHLDFKDSLLSKRIRLPAPEPGAIDPTSVRNVPCAKAIYELKRLNDSGVKVDHPPNGSNDMIQCYIGVHRLIKNADKILQRKDEKDVRRQLAHRGVGRIVYTRR